MKTISHGQTKKVLMLEDEVLFHQGDEGNKAYMIISGRVSVEVDNNGAGFMSDGEVFGELALLLDQKRSATVKSVKPTELIEINKEGLELILNSASDEVKGMIIKLCEELSKRSEFQKIPFSIDELNSKIGKENELITKLARQIFYRLDKSTAHIE